MSARFRLAHTPAADAAPKPAAAAPKSAVKISTALKELFATESIKTKAHLDAWCGKGSRARLYAYVQEQAPENWHRVADPKAVTRGTYQSLLSGYSSDAAMSCGGSPPATPPASPPASPAVSAAPSPESLALKLAEELAEVHKREIARLTAVEAEFLSLKSKMEAARLKRNEAVRAYKARAKKSSGVPKAVEDKNKSLMDVFDFFPELVEELASEDPAHLG
jgi:hypothetical protein